MKKLLFVCVCLAVSACSLQTLADIHDTFFTDTVHEGRIVDIERFTVVQEDRQYKKTVVTFDVGKSKTQLIIS